MGFRLARAKGLGAVRSRIGSRSAAIVVLLALAMSLLGALPAAAQEVTCYTVADAGGGDGSGLDDTAEDLLTRVDPSDVDPATNETDVGTGTGSFRIEAAAFRPGTETLFAVNGGRLGTLSLSSGSFTAKGAAIGSGSGPAGTIEFNDVDGLTFDPNTGTLYGSQRVGEGGPDVLLVIDPQTGAHVPGAFGPGTDYVQITPLAGEEKIDDLALDRDGTMYAIANVGGHGDRLVVIDQESGSLTEVGPTEQDDMEGLTVAPDGRLLGVTGKEGTEPPGEALWEIDKTTGKASNPLKLDNATDYESVGCIAGAEAEQPVTVTVDVGACPATGSPTVPVTMTIEPPGSAVVTVDEGPGSPIIVDSDGAVLDLPPGEYHWDADPVDGFFMDDDSGEFTVEACPAAEVGSITIVKDSLPDAPTDFAFEGDLGAFALDDDGDDALPGSRTWQLAPGTYAVSETRVEGWELTTIECVDPDGGSGVDPTASTATIDLDATENVVCTFTNARLAVLGNPPIPATGVPGLGILSLLGFGMIASGLAMRSAAQQGTAVAGIGLRARPIDVYSAYRVTGLPSPRGRRSPNAATSWYLPRRDPCRVAATERGPPRTRAP